MSDRDPFVRYDVIEAMSSEDLRAEIEVGGPAAVVAAMEAELARRSDSARLNAMLQGSVPRDIAD